MFGRDLNGSNVPDTADAQYIPSDNRTVVGSEAAEADSLDVPSTAGRTTPARDPIVVAEALPPSPFVSALEVRES